MFFQWLKRYMPRGLYGRAALILVLPVVMIQLVVFIVFAQRHFTDMSTQLTGSAFRDINLVLFEVAEAPDQAAALTVMDGPIAMLGVSLSFVPESALPPRDTRLWYDFSSTVFVPQLRSEIPGIRRILLAEDLHVDIFVDTPHGLAKITMPRWRFSARKSHQLYVNMVFFSVVSTLIAFIYLRNQLRPIMRLASTAEAFGRGRHIPYAPSGATEVRAAGAAFLDMRARIERHIEQRTLMLSGVSHDLRSPLTRLKLGLAMLDDEERAPLERDVEEMQRLVDEFLSFVQGGAAGMDPEPVDPVELARLVVDDAVRAGQAVTLFETKGQGVLMLRDGAMRRALGNLVSNAVRYGGRAEVSVMITEKSLRLRVEDPGNGIPEAQRSEARKPFVRLDAARGQNRGAGVGLGLAIATDIARAHGGVLRLSESTRLGGLCADIVIAR